MFFVVKANQRGKQIRIRCANIALLIDAINSLNPESNPKLFYEKPNGTLEAIPAIGDTEMFVVIAYVRGTDIEEEYEDLSAAVRYAEALDTSHARIEYRSVDGSRYDLTWSRL